MYVLTANSLKFNWTEVNMSENTHQTKNVQLLILSTYLLTTAENVIKYENEKRRGGRVLQLAPQPVQLIKMKQRENYNN